MPKLAIGYDYDTFAADLDGLLRHLDVKEAALVGFSMGGGEVVRYVGKFGAGRVSKAVFAAAVPPSLTRRPATPAAGSTTPPSFRSRSAASGRTPRSPAASSR